MRISVDETMDEIVSIKHLTIYKKERHTPHHWSNKGVMNIFGYLKIGSLDENYTKSILSSKWKRKVKELCRTILKFNTERTYFPAEFKVSTESEILFKT